MKCYNCGADLPNGSKFCGVCGAQQLKAAPKKRSAGHKVLGIIFVLLFLAIIITALFLVYRVFYKKGDAITYYKGSQLLQKDISKLKKDPTIISEGFSDVTDEFFNSSDLIRVSEDKKYIFYPQDLTYEEDTDEPAFSLMKSKNYSEESEQIASSVRNYQIIDNDRLVYQSTDKDLYFINGEDKEKIASYTYEYEINKKNNYIIWSTENEEYSENEDGDSDDSTTYDLYVQSLNIEGEKVKILSGVNSYFFYEDSILALTGDQLFYVNGANKASKIADGVTGQYWLQKNDAIYYVRGKSDEYLDYTEWVNDPYIDQDYTEPDYFSEDGSWEAWEARESVRDSIPEITKYGNESLYCYKDGKETKITDGFNYIDYNYDVVDSDDSFVFFRYNMQLFKKVEIDELVGMEGDYASAYNTAMQNTLETCLYIDGNIIKLQENLSNTSINEESGTGYGILFNNEGDDETSTGVLYSFKATKESEGSVTKITDNVYDIVWTDNNGVYYRKDVNDKGEGTLYFNDKKIEDSVNAVEAIHDGNVIYSINEDSLVSFDGKNNDRIADDVYAYGYYGDGLLILHDYDFHSNNGTLSYYTGKKDAELIDNNVSGFPGSVMLDY